MDRPSKRVRSPSPETRATFQKTHECRDPQKGRPLYCRGSIAQVELPSGGLVVKDCDDSTLLCPNCAWEREIDGAEICVSCKYKTDDAVVEASDQCARVVDELDMKIFARLTHMEEMSGKIKRPVWVPAVNLMYSE